MLRDHLFYSADTLLSRELAAIPYDMALRSLQVAFSELKNVRIWCRNSFKKGNFVFGLSDLDITVLIEPGANERDLKAALQILRDQKKVYPFLGEANFYPADLLNKFYSSKNYFEILRDPELLTFLPAEKTKDLALDKVVFLLRMFFADHAKLTRFPYLRQKKWQNHFNDLGIAFENDVAAQDVISAIANISGLDKKLVEETLSPLKSKPLSDEHIFTTQMPAQWKFLFPHKHLWFDRTADENLAEMKGTILGRICMKQIEWEMWGLMTQYPLLKAQLDGFDIHINRLVTVANILAPDSHISSQARDLIKLVHRP